MTEVQALWCIATASAKEIGTGELDRLLASARGAQTRFVLILRGVSSDIVERYARSNKVATVSRTGQVSLSRARNLGLMALSKLEVGDQDLVCFPDDDAAFWPQTEERLFAVAGHVSADFIGGSYGESDVAFCRGWTEMTASAALLKHSSITLFVRWSLVKEIGAFNEGLGAGTDVAPYGEDNDFAVRAWKAAAVAVSAPSVRMFHLEGERSTGRNPKGYLTVAALHWTTPAICFTLVKGCFAAVLQDIARGRFRSWSAVNDARVALSRPTIRTARGGTPELQLRAV